MAITDANAPVPGTPAPPIADKPSPQGAGESFADTMARLGGFSGDDEAPEAPEEAAPAPEAPAAEAAADPKLVKVKGNGESLSKGKKVLKPGPQDALGKLQELAKELDMEVVAGKVLPSERNDFREWKRKQKEAMQGEHQTRMAELEKREQGFQEKLKKADALLAAADAADYEGLAKLLGHDDWDKLQESVIARLSDPNYKRLRELERRDQERMEAEAKQKQEAETRAQQQQRAQAIQAHMVKLGQHCAASKDPVVQAMADEPNFIQAIFNIQRENYDQETDSTVTPEQAIKMAVRGAPRALIEELKTLAAKLNKAFGSQVAANGNAPAQAMRKPAPKSAVVPPTRSTEATSEKVSMTKKEHDEYFRRRMAEAVEADRKAGL